jgi:glutaredoxin
MKNFILFMAGMALFFYAISPSGTAEFYSTDIDPDCAVVLFSTSWCGACKQTREFLERRDYNYCEYDVEKGSPEIIYFERLGTKSVPTIVIGNKVVIGGDFKEIEKFIKEFQ